MFGNFRFKLTVLISVIATFTFAEVKVGVFLPFKANGPASQRAVEYYRGLLMAVDSLSQDGTEFKVTAADCGNSVGDIKSLLDETKNGVYDIIFAPSNQQQLEVINAYSKLNGSKIVVPFGGRYDEIVTNPNVFVLKVTQTDYTPQAYRLIASTFKGKSLYVINANGGKEICPFSNYIIKYVKGVKILDLPDKEQKLIQLLNNSDAVIIPSMYDEATKNVILQAVRKVSAVKAAVIGYPSWTDNLVSAKDRKILNEMNAYVLQQSYPRMGYPRVKKFIENYEANFDVKFAQEPFSFPMWGFDSGYFLLKGVARHKMEFYDQKLYSAPLQTAFRFEPRATLQGLINTMVLMVHYKTDGNIELVEATE